MKKEKKRWKTRSFQGEEKGKSEEEKGGGRGKQLIEEK